MGHNVATWKTLEAMMLELKAKGVTIPTSTIEDLRSAKSMIILACSEDRHGDAVLKAEEYLANVEAFLVTEAQKILSAQEVDLWLQRLEAAGLDDSAESFDEGKFVTGVPKNQKWIRVEPTDKLSAEWLHQIAAEQNLQINPQRDGRLLVYGSSEDIRKFVKKMTAETTKDKLKSLA